MPVILFVVLYLYISYRKSVEKKETAELDKRVEYNTKKSVERYNKWISNVVDDALEEKMIKAIRDRDPKYIDEIKSTILEYPEAAKGKAFDNIIYLNEYTYRGKYYATHQATRILMANRGKLMREDAICGIDVGFLGTTRLEQREYNKNDKAYITWINSMLLKHGINEPLYLTLPNLTHPTPWNIAVNQLESMGKAAWGPIVF